MKTAWKICQGLWWLIGLFVAVQYLYWEVCMIGWWLGQNNWPEIDRVWLTLAVGAAFTKATEACFPSLRRIDL